MPTPAIELWYIAARERFGCSVLTNRPDAAAQALYRARREAFDLSLEALAIIRSPTNPEGELWIIRKDSASFTPEAEANDQA